MQTVIGGETREAPVTFRRGAGADNYAAFLVLEHAIADLVRRFGSTEPMSADDPAALARMWQERRPLYDFLAANCDQFWVAERDGKVVGYARSMLYGDAQQLTEFFVMPDSQSKGVGRGMLERAFPSGPRRRFIIATPDFRAQGLYMKTGLYPRGTIHSFGCTPAIVSVASDLGFALLTAPDADTLATLSAIDEAVLGFRRESTHAGSSKRGKVLCTPALGARSATVILASTMGRSPCSITPTSPRRSPTRKVRRRALAANSASKRRFGTDWPSIT